MTYTTQELIEILDRELQANWKGKRVVLSSAQRINDPVVAKLLDMDRVSKVFAYQDFRSQVHQYQQEHQVSGIIWHTCTFGEETIRYPEVYNQLIAIESDKAILMESKALVIDFWQRVTADMRFWLANAPGSRGTLVSEVPIGKVNYSKRKTASPSLNEEISLEYVNKSIFQAEWAEIDATRNEVYLGLCWGDPSEYRYQWAKPKSGCDRIIASDNEPSSIKI
jgi:hypothetical protein